MDFDILFFWFVFVWFIDWIKKIYKLENILIYLILIWKIYIIINIIWYVYECYLFFLILMNVLLMYCFMGKVLSGDGGCGLLFLLLLFRVGRFGRVFFIM